MTTMSHVELVLNVGSRRSREAAPTVLAALKAQKLEPKNTNYLKPGIELADLLAEVLSRKPTLVILGGGDGTISEAVDYLVDQPVEVGIIPLGTTNNFARSLNIPLDIEGAVGAIVKRKAKPVDLGNVNGDYFTNVAGIGLSALIASNVTNTAKKRYGRLAYAITGFKQLLRHQSFTVTLSDKDRELQTNFETHQLIVANGRYHAGKQIASDAKLDNGKLIIFALGSRSKLSFAWHTLDYYLGRRKQIAHESFVIGNDIVINTSRPQPVELDGEVKLKTPLTIAVAPVSLKIRH